MKDESKEKCNISKDNKRKFRIINNIVNGDMQEWGQFLNNLYDNIETRNLFYQLKRISPYKNKIVFKIFKGLGFTRLEGELVDFLRYCSDRENENAGIFYYGGISEKSIN